MAMKGNEIEKWKNMPTKPITPGKWYVHGKKTDLSYADAIRLATISSTHTPQESPTPVFNTVPDYDGPLPSGIWVVNGIRQPEGTTYDEVLRMLKKGGEQDMAERRTYQPRKPEEVKHPLIHGMEPTQAGPRSEGPAVRPDYLPPLLPLEQRETHSESQRKGRETVVFAPHKKQSVW